MEMFSFYLENILRPVFEDPKLIQEERDDLIENDELEEDEEEEATVASKRASLMANPAADQGDARSTIVSEPTSKASNKKKLPMAKRRGPEDILDLSGPKLIEGCRAWIIFYELIGQLNWLGVPFYLSIIYKMILLTFICYIFYEDFVKGLLSTSIVDLTYRNPIFIFISFLAITSTAFNSILAIYTNLFNLCPLFKVLTTPRLCFITEEVQHIIGTKTITCIFIFYAYHTCLLTLLVHANYNEFFNQFNIGRFLVFLFCSVCSIYHLIGLSHLDFYIRACFASWLIALKGNLEYRFAHLHKHQRLHRLRQAQRLSRLRQAAETDEGYDVREQMANTRRDSMISRKTNADNKSLLTRPSTAQSQMNSLDEELDYQEQRQMTLEEFKEKYKIVTLDEIQKNLNTMDDHLEVWRSIQTSSLVLITLNAFLTNGALLLLAYNMLANRGNYYHGLLLILLVTNYTIVIFFCYIGDSWLYYALSSFVQTVEDEYFLQGGESGDVTKESNMDTSDNNPTILQRTNPISNSRQGSMNYGNESRVGGTSITSSTALGGSGLGGSSGEMLNLSREHQLLLIKKKDVLFCREFLHQFENHLATPWSKLTVKVHLRMVGTFVTLIAAQIIFDHEH